MSQIKYIKLSDEQVRARSRRSIAIALGLLAFIILVFFVTLSRMNANNQARQAGERAALATLERADPELPAPIQPDAAPLTTEAPQP